MPATPNLNPTADQAISGTGHLTRACAPAQSSSLTSGVCENASLDPTLLLLAVYQASFGLYQASFDSDDCKRCALQRTRVSLYIYIYTYIYILVDIYIQVYAAKDTRVSLYIYIYIYIYIYTCRYIYIYIYTCRYIYIYLQIYIYRCTLQRTRVSLEFVPSSLTRYRTDRSQNTSIVPLSHANYLKYHSQIVPIIHLFMESYLRYFDI